MTMARIRRHISMGLKQGSMAIGGAKPLLAFRARANAFRAKAVVSIHNHNHNHNATWTWYPEVIHEVHQEGRIEFSKTTGPCWRGSMTPKLGSGPPMMWLQDSPTHSSMLTRNIKSSTCAGNLARGAMSVNLISFAATTGSCHSRHSRWMKTELSTDGFDLRMLLRIIDSFVHQRWRSSIPHVQSYPGSAVHHPMMLHVIGWLTGANSIIGECTAEPGYDRASGMEVLHLCCTWESLKEFEIKILADGTWGRTQVRTTWARTRVRTTWARTRVRTTWARTRVRIWFLSGCAQRHANFGFWNLSLNRGKVIEFEWWNLSLTLRLIENCYDGGLVLQTCLAPRHTHIKLITIATSSHILTFGLKCTPLHSAWSRNNLGLHLRHLAWKRGHFEVARGFRSHMLWHRKYVQILTMA